METQGNGPQDRSANNESSGIGRALAVLLRVLFVVVLAIALALAVYFGVPRVYRDWILPVRENSARIEALERAQATFHDDQEARLGQIGDRLASLEGKLGAQVEQIAELGARVETLNETSTDLEAQIASIGDLESQIKDIKGALDDTNERLDQMQQEVADLGNPSQQLALNLQLLRVMELVNRSRLWLVQGNFGLAGQQIQTGIEAMDSLVDEASQEDMKSALMAIRDHLSAANERLRVSPVVADNELEIAWRLLLEATAPSG
jgi:DNA repair exonuclease SbcCD ATPase subunit